MAGGATPHSRNHLINLLHQMTTMDSNPSNSNNAQAQSTDWAAVRSFYLTCRSYKQTAEHFGLTITCVRSRCYREKWAEYADENTQSKGDGYASDMQNEASAYPTDMQETDSAYSPDMQNKANCISAVPSVVPSLCPLCPPDFQFSRWQRFFIVSGLKPKCSAVCL